MKQPISSPYPISDFLEWEASKQLIIAPKFQRRDIWIPKAKSYLIDSILRSMPIPPLFIRLKTDPVRQRTVREVVDGQQRLRAVLGFIKGEFPILKAHNQEFAGMTYADLPEAAQKCFLGYKFVVNTLEDVSNSEVLGIFARMNTYTVRLNAQELRNAEYFGLFKEVAYKLAHEHNVFWTENNLLRDMQVARMKDAELVSILLVTMLAGIRQTKTADLNEFYERCDDEFPQAEEVADQFQSVIDIIGSALEDGLKSTPFRRLPLFYSLFVAVFDAKFGLPNSHRPRIPFNSSQIHAARTLLRKLSDVISSKHPTSSYQEFINAARYSTADVGTRELRHRFLWDNVFSQL